MRLSRLPRLDSGKIDYAELARRRPPPREGAASLEACAADFLGGELDPSLPLRLQGLDSLGAFELAAKLQERGLAWTPEDLMQELPLAALSCGGRPMSAAAIRQRVGCPVTPPVPAAPSAPEEPRLVLLTGASGFLGLELLCRLQRRLPHTRFLLALRGDADRLRRLARERGLTPDFSGLEFLAADLALPDLGLDERARARVLQADTFVHAAADLRSGRSFDELAAVNFEAVRELARLYRGGSGRRFHFVSSLAIFACSDAAPTRLDEDARAQGRIFGAYAQTKLAAETLLESQIGPARGLRILRPALIGGAAGRSDLPQQDFFTWMLRALASQPLDPAAAPPGLRLAVSTLEEYAETLAAIVAEDRPGPVFHLAPRQALELSQLCEAACALDGRRGLDLDSWCAAQQGTPLLAALNGLVSPRRDEARGHDLFLATGIDFQGSLPAPDQTLLLTWLRQAQLPRPAGSAGLVLGKFLPPHRGHLHLVEFARRRVERLYVVVGTLEAEPIPGDLRSQWMRALCPGCTVLHLEDENPQQPEEHPDFWGIWERSLKRTLPEAIDFVFASERYGAPLAAVLGARFIPCDIPRRAFPVSGTAVRRDPAGQWPFLPPPVQAHYRRRVTLFGPESCGKSTLAAALAAHFGGSVVPEFARDHLAALGHAPREDDLPDIARGQIALQKQIETNAGPWLFCDTDALSTCVWQERLFGRPSAALAALAADSSCEFTLLCDIDLPWVADPVRYLPDDRQGFLDACRRHLDAADRPWALVSGRGPERLHNAIAALQQHFGTGALAGG